MNLNITGQLALVTASTGGIGLEIAASLAQEGARVLVNGRGASGVAAAVAKIRERVAGAQLVPLVADLSTEEGFREAVAAHPRVDILINNLGIYEVADFFECSDDRWRALFEVNILSGVRLARHYLKEMLAADRGRVVFISSESAVNPAPEMAHYSATKLMQLSISRSLAELTKGTRVTVNAILPGSTKTDGVDKFIADVFPGIPPEEAERRFIDENRPNSLIRRLIAPAEIADLVAYVCGGPASAINGAALRVDGGIVRNVI